MNKAALCLLSGILISSSLAQASIINPDFSAGFANWQAEVSLYNPDSGTYSTDSGSLPTLYPDSFMLDAGVLTLQTGSTADLDEVWSLVLFQDFQLAALAAGETLQLSLQLDAMLTDGGSDDFYFVQLRDLDSNDIIDLSAGGSFDISAFAARNLSLEFGLQDMDFVLGDRLQISALSLNRVAAVPSAGSLSLFAPLLLWLGWQQRRRLANRRQSA